MPSAMKKGFYTLIILTFLSIATHGQTIKCSAIFYSTQVNGLWYSFVNTSSGSQNKYHWEFSDGTVLDTNSKRVNHTFTAYGSYYVCLSVFLTDSLTMDTLCSDNYCDTINVSYQCVGIFSFYEFQGNTFHFDASATKGSQNAYHWNFGDGTTLDTITSTASHTFPGNGIYYVCLIVYHVDSLNHDTLCSYTTYKNVPVGNYCVASFGSSALSGFYYHFFDNSQNSNQNAYHWDFGDGTVLDTTSKYPGHTFPGNGIYRVCLTVYKIDKVTHDTLCSDSTCKTLTIGQACVSSFGFYQGQGLRYHFYEDAQAGVQNTYHWDFGDGTQLDTTCKYVIHTFPGPGTYLICLTAFKTDSITHDTLCTDTYCDTLIINPTMINEMKWNGKMVFIYPNPALNEITIDLPAWAENNSSFIEFINMEGKIMQKSTIRESSTRINTSGWPKGVYIIRITDNDSTLVKKIFRE